MEEINIVREVMTVVSFLTFAGVIIYAFTPKNRDRFEEAARLPLSDDHPFQEGEEGR